MMLNDLQRQRLERLAMLARDGDRPALESLLRELYPQIQTLCHRMLGPHGDVDDVTQQALISVSRGISSFHGASKVTTWAHRITTNACLDELRKRKRRPEPTGLDEAATAHADSGLDVVELSIDITTALNEIPEDFRAAVVLRDVADLDYAEIAELLGTPIGTVKSRIARGRGLLAKMLDTGNNPAVRNVKGDDHV